MMIVKSRSLQVGVLVVLVLVGGIVTSTLALQGNSAEADGISERSDHPVPQDDEVSRAELDEAFQSMLACMDDSGVQYTEPAWDADAAVPMWDYNVMSPQDQPNAGMAAHDDCWAEHFRDLQSRAMQHQPTADERAENEAAAVRCAQDLGLDVQSFAEFDELDLQQFEDEPEFQRGLLGCNHLGHRGVNPVEQGAP